MLVIASRAREEDGLGSVEGGGEEVRNGTGMICSGGIHLVAEVLRA